MVCVGHLAIVRSGPWLGNQTELNREEKEWLCQGHGDLKMCPERQIYFSSFRRFFNLGGVGLKHLTASCLRFTMLVSLLCWANRSRADTAKLGEK